MPFTVDVVADHAILDLLADVHAQQVAMRDHEYVSLADIRQWSTMPPGAPLYESAVVYEYELVDHRLRKRGADWTTCRFEIREESGLPLTSRGLRG